MFEKLRKWLTWATLDEAVAEKEQIAWYKKIFRKLFNKPQQKFSKPITCFICGQTWCECGKGSEHNFRKEDY